MPAPEIPFEAAGQAWRFKFGFGALCTLEEEYDLPILEVLGRCFPEFVLGESFTPEALLTARTSIRVSDMRRVMIAGLRDHHPNVTEGMVNDILDDIGIDEAGSILQRAAVASMGGGETTKNPPKRRSRNGSTATGSSAAGAKQG